MQDSLGGFLSLSPKPFGGQQEERSMAIARPLDIDDIERGLRKNVTSVMEQYKHYLG